LYHDGQFDDSRLLINLAKTVYEDTAAREMDLLVSCGEVISSVIVANTLRKRGLDAMVLTGGQAGIITDSNFTNAIIMRVEPDHLVRHINEGKIVVVAGFQGVTESGDITTLGRGGSDTTAAALGAALNAAVVDVFTDVDGVKTADPKIVPGARTISQMTYDEVAQIAVQGGRVVHPRAVEICMRANVPLRIRSTFDDSPGTLVAGFLEEGDKWPELAAAKPVTAVAHISPVTQFRLTALGEWATGSGVLALFRRLADAGISVDMISVTPRERCFTVAEKMAEKALATLRAAGLDPEVRRQCAKVSVVGHGMTGRPGVMAKVAEALAEAGVEIIQTADSHTTISCLVPAADLEGAVRALHDKFELGGKGECSAGS
ncbi:MAG: aspartate kinase, partial [Firmicutes bacterium]|nr:aspartate kinase [Bacillota bacterium]